MYIYNKAVQYTTPPYISFHWNLCDSRVSTIAFGARINIVLLEDSGQEVKLNYNST